MSRSIEQKHNPDGFVKPGELVDIRSGHILSLQDRRIFNLLIENAWSEIGENKSHRIAMNRLRGPRHRGGERVQDSVRTLMTTVVEVPTMLEGKPSVLATQLLGETTRTIDEDSPSAVLVYAFPPALRKLIQDSRYWGRIKAFVMFQFSSKYALAMYEAICLRANLRKGQQKFTVEEFRNLLGIAPGKLTLYKSLKQRVIDAVIIEINGLTDFNITIDPLRDGGLVRGPLTGFELHWEKKTGEQWAAVLDELMRTKVGRAARIAGKADTARDDFDDSRLALYVSDRDE